MKGKSFMKNAELINKADLLADVERIYNDHYAHACDQTIHDMYNAIVKRIKRAPDCSAKTEEQQIQCRYLKDGLCMGQKCMPQCFPNSVYCPKRKCNDD